MHITIINLHSSANLGDAAITSEMIRQFKETFPEAKITLVFNDPKSHPSNNETETVGSFRSWVLKVDEQRQETWHILAFPSQLLIAIFALITYYWLGKPIYLTRRIEKQCLLDTYFNTDMVVGCGGQVFSTKRCLAVSFYWIVFSTLYAYWAGKPVYIYPQTIGPVVHWHHKTFINFLMKRVRLIMARDSTYKTTLSTVLQEKTILLPDAAFGLPPKKSEHGWYLLREYGVESEPYRLTVGMTVMNWVAQDVGFSQSQQDNYDEAIIQLLRHIVYNLQGRVFLFGQVTGPTEREDDRLIAKRLMHRAGLIPPDVILFDELTTIEKLLTAYATLDIMVGTRMHSTIMSLVSSIPVCAISYLNKAKSMFDLVGLSSYACCDIRTVSPDQLITMFDHTCRERTETKYYLQNRMPQIAQMAQLAPKLIKQDWVNLTKKEKTSNKIRVMFIVSSFAIEGPQGGIERFVVELADQIDLSRFQITVCGLWYHGLEYENKWMDKLSQRGVTVLTTANWTGHSIQDTVTSFRFLQKYLANQPPFDIINSQAAYTDIVAIGFWVTGKARRLIRTVQNEKEWTHRPILYFFLHNVLAPLMFYPEISVSKKIKKDLDNRVLAKSFKKQSPIVYNAINLERFNQSQENISQKRISLGIPENAPVIGNIGRLATQKGHLYFLEMAYHVMKNLPDCHFVIVGTGNLLPKLQQKALSLGLNQSVHFLGPREDIEALLCLMDVYVSSSLWEGLSLVLLEAMAANTPIVATRVSGTVELIQNEKTGLLVPPKDSLSLSKAVIRLLRDRKFATMMAQNAKQNVQKFDIRFNAVQYYQLFFSKSVL